MDKVPPEVVRSFLVDNRSNPSLHNLCVNWAYETLKIAFAAVEALNNLSRVQAHAMSWALMSVIREECERDLAYFEAAALIQVGLKPPEVHNEDD